MDGMYDAIQNVVFLSARGVAKLGRPNLNVKRVVQLIDTYLFEKTKNDVDEILCKAYNEIDMMQIIDLETFQLLGQIVFDHGDYSGRSYTEGNDLISKLFLWSVPLHKRLFVSV